MKNSILFSAVLLGCAGNIYAQEEKKAPLTVNGYAEAYYIRDFNNPLNNTRPSFVYSHNRTNEINLNLAFIKANYSTENVRANLALAAGTYMNANYSAEPGVLKNLYEANVGVKISGKHNLWIDAGVFSAHIGVESAVGKDGAVLQVEKGSGTALMGREQRVIEHIGHFRFSIESSRLSGRGRIVSQ